MHTDLAAYKCHYYNYYWWKCKLAYLYNDAELNHRRIHLKKTEFNILQIQSMPVSRSSKSEDKKTIHFILV